MLSKLTPDRQVLNLTNPKKGAVIELMTASKKLAEEDKDAVRHFNDFKINFLMLAINVKLVSMTSMCYWVGPWKLILTCVFSISTQQCVPRLMTNAWVWLWAHQMQSWPKKHVTPFFTSYPWTMQDTKKKNASMWAKFPRHLSARAAQKMHRQWRNEQHENFFKDKLLNESNDHLENLKLAKIDHRVAFHSCLSE